MTLKDLLAPDLFSQVEAAINEHNAKETDKLKHVRYVDLSEGQYVSRNKFDDTTNQLKQQHKLTPGNWLKRKPLLPIFSPSMRLKKMIGRTKPQNRRMSLQLKPKRVS